MPNKDSFTFSDKLRKSKSVPLSKRLPSIVGGQNKQKRTLVQRAQRDLPFILVAACALLLLPFLSRNGSDDITGPANFDWDREGNEMPYIDGGGNNIEPAGGMQDPLDLILTPRSATDESITPEQPRDAYGTSRTPRTDYSTRKGYDDEYKSRSTTPAATSKFGKTARPAVRKSVERTPTKTRELRVSQMPSTRGATSTSHALPTGQAPKSTPSGSSINPGVRPVALQRMEARGPVGRSMTGENLYAEAARSIGAMNAGGSAKSNLLAAQMKDQDGRMSEMALGGGAFGGAGSPRPGGAGGGPNNSNGYNIGKPWWWDMMQARSQKWWELFEYKWREMLWTNIYDIIFNGGKQIVNCLLFGNKEVDVSNMFGASAGDPKILCEGNPNWKIPLDKYLKQGKLTSKTSDGKATEERSSVSEDSWIKICTDGGGHVTSKDRSDKGILQTRAECLGLDVLFSRFKNNKSYNAYCSKVNNDPMEFTYSVTKSGEESKRLENKAVVALVAKVTQKSSKAEKAHWREKSTNEYDKLSGQEIVIYAQVGHKFTQKWEDIQKYYNSKYCQLTKLVAFVPRGESKRKITKRVKNKANFDYTKEGNEDDSVNNWIHYRGQIKAAQDICNGRRNAKVHPLTLDDVYDDYDAIDELTEYGAKVNSVQQCPIWRDSVEFTKDGEGKSTKKINDKQCELGGEPSGISINQRVSYEATIKGAKDKNVFAVLVENIGGQSSGSRVISIFDFTTEENKEKLRTCNEDTCTYKFNELSGTLGLNPNEMGKTVKGQTSNGGTGSQETELTYEQEEAQYNSRMATCATRSGEAKTKCEDEAYAAFQQATHKSSSGSTSGRETARGSGRIIWIVTDAKQLKKKAMDELPKLVNALEASDFVDPSESNLYSSCDYVWCNDEANCSYLNPDYTANRENSVCRKGNECYIAAPLDNKNTELFAIGKTRNEDCNGDNIKECTVIFWEDDGKGSYTPYKIPHKTWTGIPPITDQLYQKKQVVAKHPSMDDPLYPAAQKHNPATDYPLFPQYISQAKREQAVTAFENKCVDVNLGYSFNNADIKPSSGIDMEAIKNKFKECQEYIVKAGGDALNQTIYFYGLASTDGEIDPQTKKPKQKCKIDDNHNSQTPQECNLALSADRAIYAMIEIANNIRSADNNVLIAIEPDENAANLYGFENTNEGGTKLTTANRRYSYEFENDDLSINDDKVKKIKFIAKALGSEGALGPADKNRVLFISFDDNLQRNACVDGVGNCQ